MIVDGWWVSWCFSIFFRIWWILMVSSFFAEFFYRIRLRGSNKVGARAFNVQGWSRKECKERLHFMRCRVGWGWGWWWLLLLLIPIVINYQYNYAHHYRHPIFVVLRISRSQGLAPSLSIVAQEEKKRLGAQSFLVSWAIENATEGSYRNLGFHWTVCAVNSLSWQFFDCDLWRNSPLLILLLCEFIPVGLTACLQFGVSSSVCPFPGVVLYPNSSEKVGWNMMNHGLSELGAQFLNLVIQLFRCQPFRPDSLHEDQCRWKKDNPTFEHNRHSTQIPGIPMIFLYQ